MTPNHPHDARGALSYLRSGRGAYGYFVQVIVEGDLLGKVNFEPRGQWILRLTVPAGDAPNSGLTLYAGDCGRFPSPPTLIVE